MKAILGFLAFVVLIIFIVVVIARGGRDEQPITDTTKQLSTAATTDAVFEFDESGPIVSEEEHFKIVITVSRSSRRINVIRGYNGMVVASQSFSNTQAAFQDFLSALDRAGYTGESRTPYESEDGLCPKNRRYVFESNQFGEAFRRWTTSCREKGNFAGNFSTTRTLYRAQIPDIQTFINTTRSQTGLQL